MVLLSGGLDSATCLALARADGFDPACLLVQYGQRHAVELERARVVARAQGVSEVRVVTVDLRAIGGSALTADVPVPKDRPAGERSEGIPVTYVPARNTVFLALALGLAETLGAADVYIGVNAVDYSGSPTAGRSSSAPSRRWPTSPPAPAWKGRASTSMPRCRG